MRVGRWWWQVCLVGALSVLGCDSGSGAAPPKSLAELGIDDGASAGLETSALVRGDEEAAMELATGARVKIPQGAVDKQIRLGLKRPPDREALALLEHLPSKNKVASAPYVVTPHGTKFKLEVEVELPIAKGRDRDKLKVVWLEHEKDTRWKELAVPEVNGTKATVRVDHFSVLLLVEDPQASGGAQPGVDDEDAGEGGTDAPGDTEPDAGSGLPDGGADTMDPGEPPLLTFPIDFNTQCPASGCLIGLTAPEDGVWHTCVEGEPITGFDPTTFDFAETCVGAVATPRFVHAGQTRYFNGGYCDSWTEALDGENRVWRSECSDRHVDLGLRDHGVRGTDGRLYRYNLDDCEGTCSASLRVSVLEPDDTAELNTQCAAAEFQSDETCSLPIALPFGPAGVGATTPAQLTSTLWVRCLGSGDPEESCSEVLAAPNSQDYLTVVRFNPNGTLDELRLLGSEGWQADCGIRIGVKDEHLYAFWCGDHGLSTLQTTWEVQRVGNLDYLQWTGLEADRVWVAVPASLQLPDPDPCAGVEVGSCVLP
jgi:hypothetical protein